MREGVVNVLVKEHILELAFAFGPEAALPVIRRWVFESAEKHIPNGEVREIFVMLVTLVMDAVHFRTLEKITDPAGGSDVHVVEVFTEGSIEQAPGAGFDRKTEQEEVDGADHERVNDDLCRMLVE